jgi:hypothetical protein
MNSKSLDAAAFAGKIPTPPMHMSVCTSRGSRRLEQFWLAPEIAGRRNASTPFQSLGARRGGKDADARLGDPSENQMLLGLKLHLLVTDILPIRDLQHSRHANDQDGCPGFRRSRDWLTVWLVATDSRARLILDCTMLVDYWEGVVGLTFSQINSCAGLAVSSLSVLVRSPFVGGPMLFLKDVQTHSTVLDCLLEESY